MRNNSRFAAIIPCRSKRHKRTKSERETQKIYRKFTDGGKKHDTLLSGNLIFLQERTGNTLELNKKTMQRIMLLITFAVLLFWGLYNISTIGGLFSNLFSLMAPLLIGVCIAFVLNLMMVGLERLWDRALAKWRSRWNAKLKRPVCLTLTMVLFLGIIFAIFFILIPRLEEAGSTLAANIPTYVDQFQAWWKNLSDFAGSHGVTLPELTLSAEQVRDTITGFLQERGDSVVNTTLDITSSIVGALVNVLLALVFSLYMLAQKETLLAQSKRLLRRALPQKAADKLLAVLHLTNNAFSSFVTGQVTEAVILGTLCCLGMLLLGLPYALPVSVIIAALSLIPIFGAWIGAATGAFLIVFQSPIKALTFLIFLLILQQVEGNLIYPRVVGKSVGLPGLWVLAAVTIGGGAFGILGMLLGVPVCSVVYSLVQAYIRTKPEAEENQ